MSEATHIQRLLPRHFKILDMAASGVRDRGEIASALGVTPQTISNVLNAPIAQDELARRRRSMERSSDEASALVAMQARERLERASPEAAQVHVDLLTDDDPSVRQRSAEAILNRVLGKAEAVGTQNITIIEVDQIQLLNLALAESDGPKDTA